MTMTHQEDSRLWALADKFAIANVLATHSRGVDRADFPLLRSAYADDGEVDYGFFAGPAETFCRILADAQKQGAVTLHRTSNMWISVEGDRGRSESYVTAYTQTAEPDGPVQRLIGGRYLDRLVRAGAGWRISHRTYVLDWNMNWPGSSQWPEADASRFAPRGGHGGADAGRTLLAVWTASSPTKQERGGGMTDKSSATLDAVLAKQTIHELGMAYCRAVDRGDTALLKSLFHPDATVVSGGVNGPAGAFAEGVVAQLESSQTRTFHSVANEWFEVTGDRAVGESYVIAFAMTGEGSDARQSIVGGRYLDRYERREGQWKFAERVFVMDFNNSQPSTAQFGEGMYASLTTRGAVGREDPVYAFWGKAA